METYLDFDLVLEPSGAPQGRSYVARVTASPAGQAEAEFDIPFRPLEIENFALKLGHRRGVRGRESSSAVEARDFGTKLFDAVFADDVALAYGRSVDEARRLGGGLRIRLRLEDQMLANIPWEFLHNAVRHDFLVLSQQTPLVRVLDVPRQVRSNDIALPLRVLVMVASPIDQPALDVEAEFNRLSTALQDRIASGHIELVRVGGSLADLQRELRLSKFHIFHFIGHGGYDEAYDDGVLVLESSTGSSDIVSGAKLGTLLHDEPTLQLVLLNACEGGRASEHDPFGGVAQSLIRKGMPAVIAMQFEISDTAAIRLSHDFYGALSDDLPVDAALAEARKAIYASSNGVEWGTPVLYLQNSSSQLFTIADTLPPPGAAPVTESRAEGPPSTDIAVSSLGDVGGVEAAVTSGPADRLTPASPEPAGSAPPTEQHAPAVAADASMVDGASLPEVPASTTAEATGGEAALSLDPAEVPTLAPPTTVPPTSVPPTKKTGVNPLLIAGVVGLLLVGGMIALFVSLGNDGDQVVDDVATPSVVATEVAPTVDVAPTATVEPPPTATVEQIDEPRFVRSDEVFVPRVAVPPSIDGSGADWQVDLGYEMAGLTYQDRWDGRVDIEATFAAAHDEDNLYILAAVADDVHDQIFDDERMFNGDALNINIAGATTAQNAGPGESDVQLTMALTGDGRPVLHWWNGNGSAFGNARGNLGVVELAIGQFSGSRSSSLLFEARIPKEALPLDPERILVSVNDSDGEHRQTVVFSHLEGDADFSQGRNPVFQSPNQWGTLNFE